MRETVDLRLYSGLLAAVSSGTLTLLILIHQKLAFSKSVSLFFLLFLGWVFISSFFSKDIDQSIWDILRTASYFSLFLVVYNLSRKNQQATNFLLVLFVSVGAAFVLKDLYNFLADNQLAAGAQLAGAFLWHNQMAGFLLFLIPVTFQLFLNSSNRLIKYTLLLLLAIFFFALILTSSRGGWLSMGFALILFAWLNLKKIQAHFKPLFAMILALVLMFPIISQSSTIIEKTKSVTEDVRSETRTVSGNLRVTVWQNSIEMIKDYPLFGVGPGAFGSAYYAYQKDPWLFSRYAHNHFLQVAAEVGIPGIIFFSGILVSAVVLGFKNVFKKIDSNSRHSGRLSSQNDRNRNSNSLLVGVTTGLIASSLHALLDFDWSTISLFLIFWIFLAIFFASLTKHEIVFEISGLKKLFYIFPLVLLITSLVLLFSDKQYKKAQAFLAKEDFKSSEKSITRAIKFNPFNAEYYLLLAEIKDYQSRQDEAKVLYKKAISLDSFNSEILYKIGMLEFEKEDYKEAKKWFEKAVKLNSYSNPKLYDGLSDSYLKLGNLKQARNTLKVAIEKAFPLNESFRGFKHLYDYTGFNKKLADTYIRLITLDLMLEEKEEAKRLLEVVEKDLDPENITLPILKKIL